MSGKIKAVTHVNKNNDTLQPTVVLKLNDMK